jgi:hypothetical protein
MPDYELANKYGYFDFGRMQASVTKLKESMISVEIDSIWTDEQREAVEVGFKALVEQYNISDQYDTLLYICLIESNQADFEFQLVQDAYKNNKRINELAQLLLLFKPTNKHKRSTIKVSSLIDTVKLSDPLLIEWVGKLVQEAITELNYVPGELGWEVPRFTEGENGSLFTEGSPLNYTIIEKFAERTIRKPGIRERNRMLVQFLGKVLAFITRETSLTTKDGVRFSDDQLNFLFKVAELFEWIRNDDLDSEPKDYISTLLNNRIIT